MAALVGSFWAATYWAASALLGAWGGQEWVASPVLVRKASLWRRACGWPYTSVTSRRCAPGTPSRLCRMGRSYICTMYREWLYSRSSTSETSPAVLFSKGMTP